MKIEISFEISRKLLSSYSLKVFPKTKVEETVGNREKDREREKEREREKKRERDKERKRERER